MFECCAKKRNTKVFQHVLKSLRPHTWTCNYVSIVYDIAFKYGQKEILNSLLENDSKTNANKVRLYSKNNENRKPERLIGAETAIVYNHPEILDHVLPKLAKETSQKEKDKLIFICLALKRVECRKVFLKYGFQEQKSLTDLDQQNELFHVLLHYPCHREDIKLVIQGYKKIWMPFIGITFIGQMFHKDYRVHVNCLLNQHCCRRINSVDFIQLMTIGEDIDLTRLQIEHLDDVFRELVELCVYSNLSNLNHLAEQTVSIYLNHYHKTDLKIEGNQHDIDLVYQVSHDTGTIGGEYTMDVKEHF